MPTLTVRTLKVQLAKWCKEKQNKARKININRASWRRRPDGGAGFHKAVQGTGGVRMRVPNWPLTLHQRVHVPLAHYTWGRRQTVKAIVGEVGRVYLTSVLGWPSPDSACWQSRAVVLARRSVCSRLRLWTLSQVSWCFEPGQPRVITSGLIKSLSSLLS